MVSCLKGDDLYKVLRPVSLPELKSDLTEGSLLSKIIQLHCWWSGAAIYIAVSIALDCCCARLILDSWIICSGLLRLMSAAAMCADLLLSPPVLE
jgi:hypothetical protein